MHLPGLQLMRIVQVQSDNLNLFLPEVNEASKALDYFTLNQAHLAPTDPVLPQDFLTHEYWKKRLTLNIDEFNKDQSVRFFIELKNNPTSFIGVANLTQISRGPFQACNLGYSISKDFQGKGLMFEALQTAISFAFNNKHLHKIMANYLPENKRSAQVLNRLGFQIHGISEKYLYINGQWRDHALTSLTNPNWQPRPEDKSLFTNKN